MRSVSLEMRNAVSHSLSHPHNRISQNNGDDTHVQVKSIRLYNVNLFADRVSITKCIENVLFSLGYFIWKLQLKHDGIPTRIAFTDSPVERPEDDLYVGRNMKPVIKQQ